MNRDGRGLAGVRASRALVAETVIHKSDDPQHLVSLSLKEKLQLQERIGGRRNGRNRRCSGSRG